MLDKVSKPANAEEEPMDDDELVALLKSEEADAASFYTSELATAQSEAMDRYFGAPYGNEIEKRSSVTTHDIEDTINWMMPKVMRVFMNRAGDDLVTCVPNAPTDEDNVQCAAQMLEHVLFEDNPGEVIVHDMAFDGFVQRLGVVSVLWQDPKPKPPEILEGVGQDQLMKLMQDPEYEILEQEERTQVIEQPDQSSYDAPQPQAQASAPAPSAPSAPGGAQAPAPDPQVGQPPQTAPGASPMMLGQPPQGQPPAQLPPQLAMGLMGPQEITVFDLKVQRTPAMGRVHIENVPPEEIAFSRRARAFPGQQRGTAESAPYVRRRQERYLADVIGEFPDKREELEGEGDGDTQAQTSSSDTDPRVLSRFQNESVSIGRESSNHQLRKKCDFYTEYLWIDFDRDDIVELRRILRVGDVILENLSVDDCEYKTFSPIRVAHKAIGRSLADTIQDLQKINTVLTRLMLDGLNQTLTPRTIVDMTKCDETTVDDLLDAEIGGVIRGKGDNSVVPYISPDVSGPALTVLEYMAQKSEQQSGVTRHAQGLDPDAITKTKGGIEILNNAAEERIGLVVRWLGLAVEDILKRALQLLVAHQDRPRWIKIKGKPLTVDPRKWSDEMAVKVHVGQGAASAQTQLQNLGIIAGKQELAIAAGGPDNPVCGVDHVINTYSRMTETMGFKDPTKFWRAPDEAKQMVAAAAAQPKPDPAMAKVQQDGQIAQAELQQKAQSNAQDLAHKQQLSAADQAAKDQDAQRAAALAQWKTEQEIALKTQQQQAEAALAERQQNFEAALALRQQTFEERMAEQAAEHERALKEKSLDHAHEVNIKKVKMNGGNGTNVEFGGKPG